jgi:hypothetical protein
LCSHSFAYHIRSIRNRPSPCLSNRNSMATLLMSTVSKIASKYAWSTRTSKRIWRSSWRKSSTWEHRRHHLGKRSNTVYCQEYFRRLC